MLPSTLTVLTDTNGETGLGSIGNRSKKLLKGLLVLVVDFNVGGRDVGSTRREREIIWEFSSVYS